MDPKVRTRSIRSHGTRGFTLVEILVILAILAVLAGVLVPVVTNQIRKAETSRVTSDISAIRTGMEAFVADVKRYPGDVEDLSSTLTPNDDATDYDIHGNAYPTGLANSWDGPYIDRVMTDGDSLDTGFGGFILDSLESVTHDNSVDYVTVVIHHVSSSDFDEVDAVIDNGDGASAGRLRWESDGTTDATRYLALPIN